MAVQIFTVSYFESFVNALEIVYGAALCSKKWRLTYYDFLNIKLHHGYFSPNFRNVSEHSCLQNHLQEHILAMSKSEHKLR